MEFPTIDKFAKDVAEKALDEYIYEGKTIREWVEIIANQQPCEDCVSRAELLRLLDLETQDTNPSHFNLEDKEDYGKWMLNNGYNTALVQARIYVENLLSAQPQIEPCEDAISRAEVINEIDRYIDKAQSTGTRDDFISFQELVVKQLPPVTPQLKTGHWIGEKNLDGSIWYMCDNCKEFEFVNYYDYCPNCGAKMEVEK